MFDLSDLSHLRTVRHARRNALHEQAQQLHRLLHPNQPPDLDSCALCLGYQGVGWAKRLEERVHVLPRRARRGRHRA